MGYRKIVSELFAEGKATSMLLWMRVRSNFISHEDRISSLEVNGGVILTGFIFEYVGASAPSGYLICDGSTKSQVSFPTLYAILGSTYGPDAGGNFTLPDFRGTTALGIGTGTALTPRSIGDSGGAVDVVLDEDTLAVHSHTFTESAHTHSDVVTGFLTSGPGGVYLHNFATGANTTPTDSTDVSMTGAALDPTGDSDPHNNLQPGLVLNYIIKT